MRYIFKDEDSIPVILKICGGVARIDRTFDNLVGDASLAFGEGCYDYSPGSEDGANTHGNGVFRDVFDTIERRCSVGPCLAVEGDEPSS